jgi:hypothetical protein
LHNLASSFVLGYHGCDRVVGERVLAGAELVPSANAYDWLGPGIYFWEANPRRGLEFIREKAARKGTRPAIKEPFVVGAVIDLGFCLDLTTSRGIEMVRIAYRSFVDSVEAAGGALPSNSTDLLRRNLDCAVMRRLHAIHAEIASPPIDTVKGVFVEGGEVYPSAGFRDRTHIQICVCAPARIKGVFRVPDRDLT